MNKLKNRGGCASCHAGKGAQGTPLLREAGEALCYRCHGNFSRGQSAGKNIEGVLSKISRHPIQDTSRHHRQGEVLPEDDIAAFRHVACADCHRAHLSTPEVPWRGTRGYISAQGFRQQGFRPMGLRLKTASEEYELCYLCHSDSANLPGSSRNMSELFSTSNASFHPVESPGRSTDVPSLVRDLSLTSTIRCTDCHGNNDVMGPDGPHASDYPGLLVADYRTDDGPEDHRHYELCYMCHDRRSILGDESFTKHNRHIVAEATSCFTCHNSHGSVGNTDLIEFNATVVGPPAAGAGPMYVPGSSGKPRCYLSCHGADHNVVGIFVGAVQTGNWP